MDKSELPFANAVCFKHIKAINAGKEESWFGLKANYLSQQLSIQEGRSWLEKVISPPSWAEGDLSWADVIGGDPGKPNSAASREQQNMQSQQS